MICLKFLSSTFLINIVRALDCREKPVLSDTQIPYQELSLSGSKKSLFSLSFLKVFMMCSKFSAVPSSSALYERLIAEKKQLFFSTTKPGAKHTYEQEKCVLPVFSCCFLDLVQHSGEFQFSSQRS